MERIHVLIFNFVGFFISFSFFLCLLHFLVNRIILGGGFILGCFPISFLVLPSPYMLVLMVTFMGNQILSQESGLLSHGNTYPMRILDWLMNESLSQPPPYLGGYTCPLISLASVSSEKRYRSFCSAGTELITARILAQGPTGSCGLSTRGSPFCSISGTLLWLLIL